MINVLHQSLTTLKRSSPLRRLVGGFAMLAAMSTPLLAAQNAAPDLPAGARPLTAFEVYSIYRDKTWLWPDGAGHMTVKDRLFQAWTNGKDGKTWADGKWLITDAGTLCFRAIWHNANGAFPAKTCFDHRIYKGKIYQRKKPNGDWYVFRDPGSDKESEFAKLTKDDPVTGKQDAITSSLAGR